MASHTVSAATAAPVLSTSPAAPRPALLEGYQPFPLLADAPPVTRDAGDFASRVLSIAGGMSVVLAALERNEIEADFEDGTPLFNRTDASRLLRMCVALAEDLADKAGELGDRLTDSLPGNAPGVDAARIAG